MDDSHSGSDGGPKLIISWKGNGQRTRTLKKVVSVAGEEYQVKKGKTKEEMIQSIEGGRQIQHC